MSTARPQVAITRHAKSNRRAATGSLSRMQMDANTRAVRRAAHRLQTTPTRKKKRKRNTRARTKEGRRATKRKMCQRERKAGSARWANEGHRVLDPKNHGHALTMSLAAEHASLRHRFLRRHFLGAAATRYNSEGSKQPAVAKRSAINRAGARRLRH